MLLVYKLMAGGSAFFIVCYLIYKATQNRTLTFFDKPGSVEIFHVLIYLSLVILVVADFFVHKHDYFELGNAPEFYVVFSFAACAVLMLIAKIFRFFVKRSEDYYE